MNVCTCTLVCESLELDSGDVLVVKKAEEKKITSHTHTHTHTHTHAVAHREKLIKSLIADSILHVYRCSCYLRKLKDAMLLIRSSVLRSGLGMRLVLLLLG